MIPTQPVCSGSSGVSGLGASGSFASSSKAAVMSL